jgi:hypothetical protein
VTHLSPERLADIDAVAGHEHLRDCSRCRHEWEQQRDVRALLRGLPGPGTIPPDVAISLHAALDRLTPDDVDPAEPLSRPGVDGPTVVPLASRRRTVLERARPWLAAAAAVVVLGGGGAALWRPWSTTRAGDSAASSGGTSSAESGAPGRQFAEDQTTSVVVASGTDYTKDGLAAQVRTRLLDGDRSASGPAASDSSTGDALASPSGLSSCLSALGVTAGAVTAVDLARFEGEPAAVLVLRAEGGGEDVWVVGRGCRQGDDQTRYFLRLP